MKKCIKILGCSAALALASSAQAGLVGYEGFDGYVVGQSMDGLSGSAIGFSAPWSGTGHRIQPSSLSYTNGGTLVTSGGSLKSTGFGNATRSLTTAITTQTSTGEELWLAYLFRSGPNTEDANVVRFFYGPSGQDGQRIDLNVTRPGTSQRVQVGAWFNNSPNSAAGFFKPNGEDNLVLLQYTKDDVAAGNQGVMRAYVNPAIGGAAPDISSAAVTFSNLGGFDSPDVLRLFSFGGGDFAVTWDEIRWGDSFASVTPVIPEPSYMAPLAAVLALGLKRRR